MTTLVRIENASLDQTKRVRVLVVDSILNGEGIVNQEVRSTATLAPTEMAALYIHNTNKIVIEEIETNEIS